MANDPFQLDRTIHKFGIYGRTTDDAQTIFDTHGFDPEKPTLILLPGTRINHEVPVDILRDKFIAGMFKSMEFTFERSNIDVSSINRLCYVYTHNDEQLVSDHFSDSLPKQHPEILGTPTPAGTDVHEFVSNVMFPLMGLRDGARPKVDEACKRLAKVTLLGHSFGSAFAHEVSRCFYDRLIAENDYTAEEAQRICSEVVSIGIANTGRLDLNEVGFRTISFCARRDETVWQTMGRIAEDHIKYGKLPPDSNLQQEQERLYRACGYDPKIVQAPEDSFPGVGRVSNPRGTNTGLGRIIEIDTPEAISWERVRNGKVTPMGMNQASLDEECEKLDVGVRYYRKTEHANGINTQPLMRTGLVPAHDIRMYMASAHENQAIVTKLDAVIKAAMYRAPLRDHELPQATLSALARATTRSEGAALSA